jgi:hypothetical protein
MPIIEAWLAECPMPPHDLSGDKIKVESPEFDDFRFNTNRPYWEKLSKEDVEWYVMRYMNQYGIKELKTRTRFHRRRVDHELSYSGWVDTYGELFRFADDTFVMKWESGSRGTYDD